MKNKAFTAMLAALLIANAQADSVGLHIGGQFWQSKASGVFGEQNSLGEVDSKKEQQYSYFFALEHPFPLLPHIRISKTSLDTSNQTNSTLDYSDDTETAHVDVHVDRVTEANFSVRYIDYTLYYQLVGNDLFSFDLGLTARDFGGAATFIETDDIVTTSRDFIWDGEDHDDHDYHNIVETTKTVNANKVKPNEIKPMLYVATNIRLPLTGLSIFAQGDVLLTGEGSHYDYQIGLNYDVIKNRSADLNLLLGYRTVNLDFDDLSSLYTDLEFKGAFVGVVAHF
ncbi:TIGR04219 family outer membrane beta-barrel protein [Thalassotalea fusca]